MRVPLQTGAKASAQGTHDDDVGRGPGNHRLDELLIDAQTIAITQKHALNRAREEKSDQQVDRGRGDDGHWKHILPDASLRRQTSHE